MVFADPTVFFADRLGLWADDGRATRLVSHVVRVVVRVPAPVAMVSETESPPDTMPIQVCRTTYPNRLCPCGTHAFIWEREREEREAGVNDPVALLQAFFLGPPDLPADHTDAFIDFARHGNEADFKALAGALGIPVADHDPMWRGTVRRVRREETRATE